MTTLEKFNVNSNKLQGITTVKALATVGMITDLWYSFLKTQNNLNTAPYIHNIFVQENAKRNVMNEATLNCTF
jgi:hypothetical protein